MHQYYVYIMTNGVRILYVGITNDLMRRVYEHKEKRIEGFTKKYNITMLAYYESTNAVEGAISREKQLKGWRRSKKIALVESMNPQWKTCQRSGMSTKNFRPFASLRVTYQLPT